MSTIRKQQIPSYRLHKPSGQTVVTLNGKDHYLGKHGTARSQGEYERLIASWLQNGGGCEESPFLRNC